MKKNNSKIFNLCFASVMIALAIVLSFIKLFVMPMGGAVTLCSMLPILLVGYFLGVKWGLAASVTFAAITLFMEFGQVSGYALSPWAFIGMIGLDYFVSFGGLGLSGIFKPIFKKRKMVSYLLGIIFAVFIRFVGGVLSGATIFSVYAEWTNPFLYALAYNGSYLSIELSLCLVVGILLYLPMKRIFKGQFAD